MLRHAVFLLCLLYLSNCFPFCDLQYNLKMILLFAEAQNDRARKSECYVANVTSGSDGLGSSALWHSESLVGFGKTVNMTLMEWPSGYSKGNNAFFSAVYDGQGSVWLMPRRADRFLRINVSTGEMTGYGDEYWPKSFTKGDAAFSGGAYDGRGFVWAIPYNADRVIRINVKTGEMAGFGAGFWPAGYTHSPYAFVTGTYDGQESVWLAPYFADRVIRINITTGNMTGYGAGYWPSGYWRSSHAFLGATCDGQGSVWMAPHHADRVVRINISTGYMTGYGVGYWPLGFTKKKAAFDGAVYDGNGSVWFVPHDADRVLRINITTGFMTGYGTGYWPTGFVKLSSAFAGGMLDGHGSLWMVPYNANRLVRVDLATGNMTGSLDDWPSGFMKAYDAFVGGAFDGRGSMWLVPYDTGHVMRVSCGDDCPVRRSCSSELPNTHAPSLWRHVTRTTTVAPQLPIRATKTITDPRDAPTTTVVPSTHHARSRTVAMTEDHAGLHSSNSSADDSTSSSIPRLSSSSTTPPVTMSTNPPTTPNTRTRSMDNPFLIASPTKSTSRVVADATTAAAVVVVAATAGLGVGSVTPGTAARLPFVAAAHRISRNCQEGSSLDVSYWTYPIQFPFLVISGEGEHTEVLALLRGAVTADFALLVGAQVLYFFLSGRQARTIHRRIVEAAFVLHAVICFPLLAPGVLQAATFFLSLPSKASSASIVIVLLSGAAHVASFCHITFVALKSSSRSVVTQGQQTEESSTTTTTAFQEQLLPLYFVGHRPVLAARSAAVDDTTTTKENTLMDKQEAKTRSPSLLSSPSAPSYIRCFYFVDIGAAWLLALLAGLQSSDVSMCRASSVLAFLIAVVYLVYLMSVHPLESKLEAGSVILLGLLQVAGLLTHLTSTFWGTPTPEMSELVGDVTMTVSGFVVLLTAVIVGIRDYLVGNQRRASAKSEVEESDGSPLLLAAVVPLDATAAATNNDDKERVDNPLLVQSQ